MSKDKGRWVSVLTQEDVAQLERELEQVQKEIQSATDPYLVHNLVSREYEIEDKLEHFIKAEGYGRPIPILTVVQGGKVTQ